MKSESGFSFAIASQPFEGVSFPNIMGGWDKDIFGLGSMDGSSEFGFLYCQPQF